MARREPSPMDQPEAIPSVWTQATRSLRGDPMVFYSQTDPYKNRPFLPDILNDLAPMVVVQKARQIGATEMGACSQALWLCAVLPSTWVIYTLPREDQVSEVSALRVDSAISDSRYLSARCISKKESRKVFRPSRSPHASLQSYLLFKSSWESALGEGTPADVLYYDEYDRMKEGVEEAFRETVSSSRLGLQRYLSTPTLPDRGVAALYERSDQRSWTWKCESCGEWQKLDWDVNVRQVKGQPDLLEQIRFRSDLVIDPGSFVLECAHCHKPIDRMTAQAEWVASCPEREVHGYHISQLDAPWISMDAIAGKRATTRLVQTWRSYALGQPWAGEGQPILESDVLSCVNPELPACPTTRPLSSGWVSLGADWGDCHDEKTRILTERGFVYFKDLLLTDKVAQWDETTRVMSFCRPRKLVTKPYMGDLIHFSGRGVDVMVTPKHRMRVANRWTGEWDTEPASGLAQRTHATFVGAVTWEGEAKDCFTLPGLPSFPGYSGCKPHTISMDVWLEFLGYYLAEGGLCFSRQQGRRPRPSCVKMSQRETAHPQNVAKIRRCLQAVRLKFSEFPNAKTGDINWSIYGKQLWHWIQNNVGESCDTKRIPRQFFGLARRQLRILLDALMLGDGTYTKHGGGYNSTSRGLCEDFQELCVRLGFRASVNLIRRAQGNRKAAFRTTWSARGADRFWAKVSDHVKRVPCKGQIYCCTVPTGYIVTERNGHVAYHGNCNWSLLMDLPVENMRGGRPRVLDVDWWSSKGEAAHAAVAGIDRAVARCRTDIIVADAGYGQDRNPVCRDRHRDKFWACRYSNQKLATFEPNWMPNKSIREVQVGRDAALRLMIEMVKFRMIEIAPLPAPKMRALVDHLTSLARVHEEDPKTGEVLETIVRTGPDHLAHALTYALIGVLRGKTSIATVTVAAGQEPKPARGGPPSPVDLPRPTLVLPGGSVMLPPGAKGWGSIGGLGGL